VKRFLGLWLLFGAVQWVVGTILDYAVLHAIDWRFEAFCEAILLPGIAAAAIAAVIRPPGTGRRDSIRTSAREPWIGALAVAGAAILAAGWLAVPRSRFSLEMPLGLPNLWFSVQLAAAAVLGCAVALRRRWTRRERAWLLLASAGALAASARQATRWVGSFSEISPFGRSAFLPALGVELAFLVAAVALALKASAILARVDELSGRLLEASTFFPVAAAAVVAIGVFQRPRLTPAGSALAGSLLLAGAALAFASSVVAWKTRFERGAE